jgi:predicted enzyme related to lactoylglutathione lyase
MPRVVHFEINADEPDRAAKFYSDVFGWNINKWEGPNDYWLVDTQEGEEPGINGGIMKRPHPDLHTVNVIGVNNIDEFATGIMEAGGKIAKAKMAVTGVGWLAYCLDTEGNMFGIMQPDESAK